ncbi:MAG: hypothetical protein H6740_21100 [Alphaproteobacteria bacterium]|nr:hypothetical protein [Alphaproteobacteria bacterium]
MIALIALFACDGKTISLDDSGDTTVTADNVELHGVCPQAQAQGRFTVDSNEDYAAVDGVVADGVVPAEVLTELLTEGECTIWRRENPFCDPGCSSGFTCDFDGQCVPYPVGQDLGVVRVIGIADAAIEMSPTPPGNTYYDTSLSNPPWGVGELVTLRSEGGAYTPFTLYGVGPVDLELETTDWLLVPGEDVTVRWTPAPEGSRGEVVLRLRVDQHGLTPSSLECVFADDGEGIVPAATFNELISFGLTGFPYGDLRRRTMDSATLDDGGCVSLELQSSRLAHVDVDGYTPCRTDRECPDGQTCNVALERCE